MAYQSWMPQAIQRGVAGSDYNAYLSQKQDEITEAKIESDAYRERQDELSSSLTGGGLWGSLIGALLVGGKALASGGTSLLADVPAWLWGVGTGVGGGIGALKEAWTGGSAEGIDPGFFGQTSGREAEEAYFDALRSGVLSTAGASGLAGYGLAGGIKDPESLLSMLIT